MYENIGAAIDDRYIEELKKQCAASRTALKQVERDLQASYIHHLHGTGNIPVQPRIERIGIYQCLCSAGAGTSGRRISRPSAIQIRRRAEAFELALEACQRKRMPTLFWRQTRMPTASVFM